MLAPNALLNDASTFTKASIGSAHLLSVGRCVAFLDYALLNGSCLLCQIKSPTLHISKDNDPISGKMIASGLVSCQTNIF